MTLCFDTPVLLIGGGPVGPLQLKEAQRFTNEVVAADGGADTADRLGVPLSAIIGDMDSAQPEVLAKYAGRVLHDPDQNTTDFEKCLKHIDAPLIVGIGFLGGRLDHELAALNALAKTPEQKVVLLGEENVVFRSPELLELSLPKGVSISVFPMGQVTGLHSEGLQYGLDGLMLASEGRVGTSNMASAEHQVIEVAQGSLLVIIPRRYLPEAISALVPSSDN